ncbi:hypothetical protein L7F22_016667 [Adiantum nelumboides]|nr:hypothetical protein [Adiantum nelumboides]
MANKPSNHAGIRGVAGHDQSCLSVNSPFPGNMYNSPLFSLIHEHDKGDRGLKSMSMSAMYNQGDDCVYENLAFDMGQNRENKVASQGGSSPHKDHLKDNEQIHYVSYEEDTDGPSMVIPVNELETDLSKELKYLIPIKEYCGRTLHHQKIVYKTIPNACFNCMKMGYFIKECPDMKPQSSQPVPDPEKKDDLQPVGKKNAPRTFKNNKASSSRNRNSFSPLLEEVFDPLDNVDVPSEAQVKSAKDDTPHVDVQLSNSNNDKGKKVSKENVGSFPLSNNDKGKKVSKENVGSFPPNSLVVERGSASTSSSDGEEYSIPNTQVVDKDTEEDIFAAQLQDQDNCVIFCRRFRAKRRRRSLGACASHGRSKVILIVVLTWGMCSDQMSPSSLGTLSSAELWDNSSGGLTEFRQNDGPDAAFFQAGFSSMVQQLSESHNHVTQLECELIGLKEEKLKQEHQNHVYVTRLTDQIRILEQKAELDLQELKRRQNQIEAEVPSLEEQIKSLKSVLHDLNVSEALYSELTAIPKESQTIREHIMILAYEKMLNCQNDLQSTRQERDVSREALSRANNEVQKLRREMQRSAASDAIEKQTKDKEIEALISRNERLETEIQKISLELQVSSAKGALYDEAYSNGQYRALEEQLHKLETEKAGQQDRIRELEEAQRCFYDRVLSNEDTAQASREQGLQIQEDSYSVLGCDTARRSPDGHSSTQEEISDLRKEFDEARAGGELEGEFQPLVGKELKVIKEQVQAIKKHEATSSWVEVITKTQKKVERRRSGFGSQRRAKAKRYQPPPPPSSHVRGATKTHNSFACEDHRPQRSRPTQGRSEGAHGTNGDR